MTAPGGPLTRAGFVGRMVAAVVLFPMVGACAPELSLKAHTPGAPAARVAFEEEGHGWWEVYFQLVWDQTQQPSWHLDALLADQIIAPVIAHSGERIFLWRFHRRAAQDANGHRFTFLFYADAETAEFVNQEVENSPLASALLESGMVKEMQLAALDEAAAQEIGAKSDPAWPEAIQRGWPWFIMGVSQSWLRLIGEVKAQRPVPDRASAAEISQYYLGVHEEISALWREHGQHAYLHHLNAVFGYQLLIIRETNLKRF
jgi:hypothetical protein